MAHVITVLAEGFEEVEAVTPVDLLRRARIQVSVLGLNSLAIRGAHGLILSADSLFETFVESADGIILPGGQPGTTNLANSPIVIEKVKDLFSRGKMCAAICAAPSVFAKAGILKGLKATCYPSARENITESFYIEQSVVCDKNVITSRGAGTAIDFSLEIIKYLTDSKTSEEIKKAIIYN